MVPAIFTWSESAPFSCLPKETATGEEVEGDNDKIRMEISAIAPHSQGIVSIDISEGYDIGAMEEKLPEGDTYYFVLTNNNFAFGQDWMCFFDFEIERTEEIAQRMHTAMEALSPLDVHTSP